MNYCHQSKKRIVNTEFFLSKEFLESVETFFLSLFFLFSGLRSICAYVMSTSSLICCTVFVIKIGQHLFATIHQFSMIWFSEKSNQMFAQHYEVIHAHVCLDTLTVKMFGWVACFWSKMPTMFQSPGLPFSPAFQYLILMTWRACYLNLVMISSVASKWQVLKFGMLIFQLFYEMKSKTSKFKVLAFWSQWRYHDQIYLHIKRIKS